MYSHYFKTIFLSATLCLGTTHLLVGQSLLSPTEFLGYEPGERFTRHHDVVSYFQHLDANSSNLVLSQYGETNEGRPLLTAFISTPENLEQLESHRINNLSLTRLAEGPRDVTGPVIVWLSYGVHGNESSSTEAAIKTAYELVGGSSDEVASWLENTIVVIDPCLNPDGRDRYVNWYNMMVGKYPNQNRDAIEHNEPWPGGRTNHYYFDLNRDWAWLTQKESVQRLAAYSEWMPHVHVDFHEQGINNPYYFAPAAEPYHELITESQRHIEGLIGAHNRQYFDANDWLYFTREEFDLLYPGYGDTWPVFNGAIGMTYEQAGSGRAGLRILNDQEHVLTLEDRINHHYTAGLSTIEAAWQNRSTILEEFANYYETAVQGVGPFANYIIDASSNSDDVRALTQLLDSQGIRYAYASNATRISGFSYSSGNTETTTVEAGDIVIASAQPKSRLLSVLMEPETALSDSLTYDITAWALPYMFNVSAVATNARVATSDNPGTSQPSPTEAEPYAYLLTWESDSDVRVLTSLLAEDVHVRYSTGPFRVGGKTYPRGTIIVTGADNRHLESTLGGIVRSATEKETQPLATLSSGFVDDGSDLGSNTVSYLKAPRVMLLSGPSLSSSSVGELWNYFDNQINYPVTIVDESDFGNLNLSDYDVVILPAGSYSGLLADNALQDLTSWIRSGGTAVAIESAASFFAGKEGFELKMREAEKEPDSTKASLLKPYGERGRDRLGDRITGAIYKARVDETHPLAFGYGSSYYTLKRSNRSFEYLTDGWNVAVIEDGEPVSGFVGHKTGSSTKESLVWGHQTMGRGDIVFLIDNPVYRGFWHGGKLVLANAVFLVGQ